MMRHDACPTSSQVCPHPLDNYLALIELLHCLLVMAAISESKIYKAYGNLDSKMANIP